MARYLGIAKETVYGTPVTPTKFIDIIKEGIGADQEILLDETVRGRDYYKQSAGPVKVGGGFPFFVAPENGIGQLLYYCLGAVSSAQQGGTSAYLHTITPADDQPSFTVEKGLDAVTALQYPGCKVGKLTLKSVKKEKLSCTVDLIGKTEKVVSLSTPSWSNLPDFTFAQGTFKLNAVACGDIMAIQAAISNALRGDEYRPGSRVISKLPVGARAVDGSFDIEFVDKVQLERFYGAANATEPQDTLTGVALDLLWEGALIEGAYKYSLGLEIPQVYYNTAKALLNKRDLIVQGIEFKAIYDATATYAIRAKLQNKETAINA